MEDRKGLLKPEQQRFFAVLIDEAVPFKNPFLEAFDGEAFNIIITVVDDNLLDKIPEDWQNPIEPIIDAAMEGNWDLAGALAADFANQKIDIPGLDELSEQLIFSGLINFLVGLIVGKAESLKK